MSRVVMEYTEYSCALRDCNLSDEPNEYGACCCGEYESSAWEPCRFLTRTKTVKSANYKLFTACEALLGDPFYPCWFFTAGGRTYPCSYLEVDGRVLHKEDE